MCIEAADSTTRHHMASTEVVVRVKTKAGSSKGGLHLAIRKVRYPTSLLQCSMIVVKNGHRNSMDALDGRIATQTTGPPVCIETADGMRAPHPVLIEIMDSKKVKMNPIKGSPLLAIPEERPLTSLLTYLTAAVKEGRNVLSSRSHNIVSVMTSSRI